MAKQYTNTNNLGTFYYKDPEMTIRHRTDGPAIEYANGYREWWVNGKRHRLDGPAYEHAKGDKVWFINGVLIFQIYSTGKLHKGMRD